MTPERRAGLVGGEAGGDAYRELVRQMGRDGWLGVGWPKEYGGQGRSAARAVRLLRRGQPRRRPDAPRHAQHRRADAHGLRLRRPEDEFLPSILAGELHFAIGYSEPGAGTDLAALRTRAVRDGDEYVINGQKVFTTGGHDADWVWLACRTDPDAPKHKGISIILVPTDVAGFKHSPIWIARRRSHERHVLRGRPGAGHQPRRRARTLGWKLITRQLNHERVALGPAGRIDRPLHDGARAGRQETTLADGTPRRSTTSGCRLSLARVHAVVEALKLANWRVAADLDAGQPEPGRRLGDEGARHRAAVAVPRPPARGRRLELGYLVDGSPGAVLHGQLEQAYRHAPVGTFGGGVNEVQREIIAMAGLGMPRAPR